MIHFFKRILRKLIINRLFNRYVKNDEKIQKDIAQTVLVRGCRVTEPTTKAKFKHLMSYYPDFAYVFFWRINKLHYTFRHLFMTDFNCKIFRSTTIEGGMMCYHPFATVINAKHIGANFQFRNSLTIGNKSNDNKQLPIIGANVTVGANVVIIGAITIGDNVTIGAGSVVVKDVESNCVIAGNPARVIRVLDHG